MARKKKSKSEKKAIKKNITQTDQKAREHSKDEETNPMDFGGMPDRDLKKNLGCG